MTDADFLQALTAVDLPPALREEAWRRLRIERAAAWRAQHVFTWRGGRDFELDGEPIRAHGVGLLLGWFVLAGRQHRLPGVRPADVHPGHRRADAIALQAIQRAALRVPDGLAGCLSAIGTAGGVLTVKGQLPCTLVCRSPELVAAVTGA